MKGEIRDTDDSQFAFGQFERNMSGIEPLLNLNYKLSHGRLGKMLLECNF